MVPPHFNYIITIHNKESLIENVLMSILMCCRDNSHVYPVIDGCTDATEEIIDRIISSNKDLPITKVYTSDVHELLSINAGLRAARQDGNGFNIILQDDVILTDFMLEKKVVSLYEWGGSELGYVSFRLGANFKTDAYNSSDSIPLTDYAENVFGHGLKDAKPILPGCFAYRSIPIKSPVCIPTRLVQEVGMFNEELAPYGHDDTELSIRLLKNGYLNGVFPIQFFSEIAWGGTRTTPHPELAKILKRNMSRIRNVYQNELKDICKSIQNSDVINVPNMARVDGNSEIEIWQKNKEKLARYSNSSSSYYGKIVRFIQNKFK